MLQVAAICCSYYFTLKLIEVSTSLFFNLLNVFVLIMFENLCESNYFFHDFIFTGQIFVKVYF